MRETPGGENRRGERIAAVAVADNVDVGLASP
jgi:hypothetical protein